MLQLHVVLIGPQHIADMHLADTLVFIVPVFTSNWNQWFKFIFTVTCKFVILAVCAGYS